MLHGFLEFKETWNKLTNVKLNHDVANQMWSEAKLGHLLLLSPFRMLETRYAWTLIMIKWLGLALGMLKPWLWSFGICLKWLGLTLGRHASCEFLAFDVAHAHTPLMGSSFGLRMIQETIFSFLPSRVQSQAFGLEFIHSIQGSNNYDGLKRWTWAHHGSNNVYTHV